MIYLINRFFQKGIRSQILFLLALTLVGILFFSILYLVVQPATSLGETLWIVSTRMLDPGTFSDDEPSIIRWVTYPVTIFGILVLSTLIGILSASITDVLIQLRRGIGTIREENFTCIIGWEYRIFHLINELIEANENQDSFTVVILAAKDKIEMDEELQLSLSIPKNVKIITRNIDPLSMRGYRIIDLKKASSIILLTSNADPDFLLLKKLLLLQKMVPENQIPIVFEVNDKSQNELLKPILTSNTFPIQRESFYSMITTHTILQSGISNVFSEIYSFRGNEIYIYPSDGFAGKTYGESLVLMNNASLIGIIQEGETILNPPHTSIIQHDDKLVIVMQDDEPISKVEKPRVLEDETKNHSINDIINITVNDILILGWNNVGNGILVELSKYITHETNITIVSDEIKSTSDIGRELQNESVHLDFVEEAHFKKQTLDSLNIGSFDKIVILSSDHLSPEESDTITISAILQIKSLMEEGKTSKIISQILVEKNVSLLNDDPILEFIVSDSLLTGMVSQIAENSELYHALHDILDEDGSEIYAVDMESLSRNTTSGISILEAYSRIRDLRGSMIGYQSFIDDKGGKRIETVINPPKDSNIHLNDSNKLLVVCEG